MSYSCVLFLWMAMWYRIQELFGVVERYIRWIRLVIPTLFPFFSYVAATAISPVPALIINIIISRSTLAKIMESLRSYLSGWPH